MTRLAGKRSYIQGTRLFEPLLTFMITADAIGIATECVKLRRFDDAPGNFSIEAHQFGLWIRFPAIVPTEAMTRNVVPTSFEVVFANEEGRKIGPQLGPIVFGYKGATLAVVTSLYVTFFEQHREWLRATYGSDTKKWPGFFNFARTIRNFIVHHDGRVHFENPKAASVQWHHLSYSPADEGKQAVGHNYISVGDMLVLTIELGDALDQAGCPFPI